MTVLIAGAGYVGTALAQLLLDRDFEVIALRRTPSSIPEEVREHPACLALGADLGDVDSLRVRLAPHLARVTHIAHTTSADERSPAAYRAAYVDGLANLLVAVDGAPIQRLVYTSSTAVYGDRGGAVVDESTPIEDDTLGETARELVRGEALVADHAGVVLRLGGIYGPTRTRLVDMVREGRARLPREPTFTNRIHRDDCAGALAHLLTLVTPAPLYLGVDEDPADYGEVLSTLAAFLDLPAPPPAAPGASPRGAGSKRCSSRRLRESGYRFRYPSFREGYRAMLNSEAE